MKTFAIFGLVLVVFLMVLSTCNKDNENIYLELDTYLLLSNGNKVDLTVNYYGELEFFEEGHEFIYVINSKNELETYFSLIGEFFNSENYYNSIKESYKDDFFENNYLVIIHHNTNTGYRVKAEIVSDNGDIVIVTYSPKGTMFPPMMISHSIVIEINNIYKMEKFQVKWGKHKVY